jgi:hypothetical protein
MGVICSMRAFRLDRNSPCRRSPDLRRQLPITDTVTNVLFLNWFQPNVFDIQVLNS